MVPTYRQRDTLRTDSDTLVYHAFLICFFFFFASSTFIAMHISPFYNTISSTWPNGCEAFNCPGCQCSAYVILVMWKVYCQALHIRKHQFVSYVVRVCNVYVLSRRTQANNIQLKWTCKWFSAHYFECMLDVSTSDSVSDWDIPSWRVFCASNTVTRYGTVCYCSFDDDFQTIAWYYYCIN